MPVVVCIRLLILYAMNATRSSTRIKIVHNLYTISKRWAHAVVNYRVTAFKLSLKDEGYEDDSFAKQAVNSNKSSGLIFFIGEGRELF